MGISNQLRSIQIVGVFLDVLGQAEAAIAGPKGNREAFVYARAR